MPSGTLHHRVLLSGTLLCKQLISVGGGYTKGTGSDMDEEDKKSEAEDGRWSATTRKRHPRDLGANVPSGVT